jgi:hypothetical protein
MQQVCWTKGMKEQLSISAVLILIVGRVCFPAASALSNRETGVVTGTVMNLKDQPVRGAVIILCDQKSGVPVSKPAFRPFTEAYLSKGGNQEKEISFSITDDMGRFSFEDVPVGEYRLIAQSWEGADKIKSVFERNGKEIELWGVAGHVRVSAGSSSNVELRPLGTGVLRIDENMPNDETLLVISTSATRADPILGFAGWGGAFMQNMIGGNRMLEGETIVSGLPEGTIYVAMFAADSVPGWTEGQAEIKRDATAVLENIPFVNSWSNSRHDPPESLLPVFEEIKQLISRKDKFIDDLVRNFRAQVEPTAGSLEFMLQLGPHLEKEVTLPSGRKATFGDVIAAVQYVELQQTMERKKEEWKKRDEAMKRFSDRQAARQAEAEKEKAAVRAEVDVSSPLSFFPDDVQAGKELDDLWAVKYQAFNTVPSEELFDIVRKGFRRTSANKNDIVGTIGSRYIWHKSPSEPAAVDILYCASFDSDVMYNAFYYGLTVAKPKSPAVLKRLADLSMQGFEVGRIAWGVWQVQDQHEEFIDLMKPYLEGADLTTRQQAQNVIKVIEAKIHGVYDTSRCETKPENIKKVREDFGDKLDQLKETLLAGPSTSKLSELERIGSLGIFHLFDDTFIPSMKACAEDEYPKVRIATAEIAGYYWIWGDTMTNPEISRLLIRLSEDDVPEVRFAAVEKGLFNIPDKTSEIIKRIIDLTLADRKQMPEMFYKRIEYVLRVNREKAGPILREYLEDGRGNQETATALYRDALRLGPSARRN